MKQNMLFLMGVLALLLASPNVNADDKEKYKLFAEETRKVFTTDCYSISCM